MRKRYVGYEVSSVQTFCCLFVDGYVLYEVQTLSLLAYKADLLIIFTVRFENIQRLFINLFMLNASFKVLHVRIY